jgi:hypothetical protein
VFRRTNPQHRWRDKACFQAALVVVDAAVDVDVIVGGDGDGDAAVDGLSDTTS